MTRDERMGAAGAFLIVMGLLLAAMQSGCGPPARQSALKGAYATVNAANATVTAWDKVRTSEILDSSSTWDEYKKRITEHRAQRDMIDTVIIVALDLIGKAGANDHIGMAAVVSAVSAVQMAVETIRRGP